MKSRIFASAVMLVFLLVVVNAEFSVKESTSSINEGPYFAGDLVEGKLNISFSEQDNVEFESNFDGGEKILEVIEAAGYVKDKDFTCEPSSCKDSYSASFEESGKYDLDFLDRKFYGFRIKESDLIEEIEEFEFSVDVYSDPSCYSQIYLDILDDDTLDYYNTVSMPYVCNHLFEKDFGCFDSDESDESVFIGENPYCELITLPPAPGYVLGAVVDKETSDPGRLRLSLWDFDEEEYVGWGFVQNPEGDISIMVNHTYSEETDALVCIDSGGSGVGKYSIRINEDEDPDELCGTNFGSGDSIEDMEFNRDYEIYAMPLSYNSITNFTFNEETYEEITGRNLILDLNEYINKTYGGDCSGSEGCVIPFAIWGEGDSYTEDRQAIYLPELWYRAGGELNSVKKVSELERVPAKIDSERYLFLDIYDMAFEVPEKDGKHNFVIELEGDSILSEKISVEVGFEFDMGPKFGFIGRPTTFSAFSDEEITSSAWDFGDGTSEIISEGNSASHTYSEEGNYVVKVTLNKESSSASSTRRFRIVVGDARTSANLTLVDYEARLENIESDILDFPEWMRESVESAVGIDNMKSVIAQKKNNYRALVGNPATTDEQFVQLINDLMVLKIPYSVSESQSSVPLPALIGHNDMNVEHIKEISGGSSVENEELRSSVISWMGSNYDVNVEYQAISALGDFDEVDFLRSYKMTLNLKGSNQGTSYLVISHPFSAIKFKTNGLFETVSGGSGAYMEISAENPPSVVEFLIAGTDSPDIAELGIYISPVVSELGVSGKPIRESWWEDEGGSFNWSRFLIGMAILLAIMLSLYVILQAWYKRYYERHLFQNPNDLYNLINFVYNSRRVGLSDKEIKDKLKGMSWKGEQVTYALNKLSGKRTGMWEIPVFKFIENRKVKKELKKKQGGKKLDARFIKRPVY